MHIVDKKWQTGLVLQTYDSQDSNAKCFQRIEKTENKDMASV